MFRIASLFLPIFIVLIPLSANADTMDMHSFPDELMPTLEYMINLCGDKGGQNQLDMDQLSRIVDFTRQQPEMANYTPGDHEGTKGSFISFSIKRPLVDIVRYSYNSDIPEGAVTPYAVNYTSWKTVEAEGNRLPEIYKWMQNPTQPFYVRGVSRLSLTPDLNTGAYYEYDIQKLFVGCRQGKSRIFLSLSNQIGPSEIGKIGYVVGHDQDWNYLYTQEKGLNRKGLGWVKSKIYSFASVCCLIEDQPGVVKVGMFQWLGAGWMGMNVVDTHHIRKGLQRHATYFKKIIESSKMPSPDALERIYHCLSQSSETLLREKAEVVIRHFKQMACSDDRLAGIDAIKELDEKAYVAKMTKAQLMNTLVREFVKQRLGKDSPLKPTFWVALQQNGNGSPKSRS